MNLDMKNLKRILAATLWALPLLTGSEPVSYQDLGAKPCAHFTPVASGTVCASGDYSSFTIRRLTDIGARPVWSPDGKRLAFVDHEWGNAFELDVATGATKCLTCNFDHRPGFLRVHYLPDGSYLLIGPRRPGKSIVTRGMKGELWWMDAEASVAPAPLGIKLYEGVAVSRLDNRIAWAEDFLQNPLALPDRMMTAVIQVEGKQARVVDRKVILRKFGMIEAQDFRDQDQELIFSRYLPQAEAMGVILDHCRVTNYSRNPGYEEPEGIFPDGKFTLIESNRHGGGDHNQIDIYMLRLDGTGKDLRRLTHFNDTPGEKASNPVVHPSGCSIAFMKGINLPDVNKPTGEGAGIFLLEFGTCSDANPKEKP